MFLVTPIGLAASARVSLRRAVSSCMASIASKLGVVALSSGEAEYYGVVKASSVALGCKSMLKDMSFNIALKVHTDAEAAKGIASRTGLGKTRHIAVHYLWVQEKVRRGDFDLKKVHGKSNPADLLTKHLGRDDIDKYMRIICMHFEEGRSSVTPAI